MYNTRQVGGAAKRRGWFGGIVGVFFTIMMFMVFFVSGVEAVEVRDHVRGYIVLQVQQNGEAWYVEPLKGQRWYLGRPDDAFRIMRSLALGITNRDLAKIPIAGSGSSGDRTLQARLKGRILLQVENHGEAWYVYPRTLRRHYLGRPADAFRIMRELGLGITNADISRIAVAQGSLNTPPASSSAIFPNVNFDAYKPLSKIDEVFTAFSADYNFVQDGGGKAVEPTPEELARMRESLGYIAYALDSTFRSTRVGEFLEQIGICRSCGYVNWGNVIFMPSAPQGGRDRYIIDAMHELGHSLARIENIDAFRLICWNKDADGNWRDDLPRMKDECKNEPQAFVPTTLTNDIVNADSTASWYSYGATHFSEDFAESIVAYRVSGAEFRRRAGQYPILAQKYNFIRQYVFNGVEY